MADLNAAPRDIKIIYRSGQIVLPEQHKATVDDARDLREVLILFRCFSRDSG